MRHRNQWFALGIIGTACFSAACGRTTDSSTSASGVENSSQIRNVPEFTPNADEILQQFFTDAARHGLVNFHPELYETELEFVDGKIDGPESTAAALGTCEWYEKKIVILNPSSWPVEYPSQERFLRTAYHELGHCVLNLLHTNEDAALTTAERTIQVPGRSRIMASVESEGNVQFSENSWPDLMSVFFDYGQNVRFDRIDGIEDAEGLALVRAHADQGSCIIFR